MPTTNQPRPFLEKAAKLAFNDYNEAGGQPRQDLRRAARSFVGEPERRRSREVGRGHSGGCDPV